MSRRRIMAAGALAVALAAGAAIAQPSRFQGGQWGGQFSGEYTCSQGLTGMTVELRPARGDEVDATVTFYAHPRNPGVESGCYAAHGTLDRATGKLTLRPTRWIFRPGEGWSMTALDGRIDAAGAYAGRVIFAANPSACRTFALRRNAQPLKAPPRQCVIDAPMS